MFAGRDCKSIDTCAKPIRKQAAYSTIYYARAETFEVYGLLGIWK
jgi:hypothetical protein